MTDGLVHDAAARLFGDLANAAAIDAAERGTWPAALWQAVETAGFADALLAGAGGALAGLPDAVSLLRAAGRHALPLPLPETMLARFACAAAGLVPPPGPLTLAPVERDDRIELRRAGGGWQATGRAGFVPWARAARGLVILDASLVAVLDPAAADIRRGASLAGEPRDEIALDGAPALAAAALPAGLDRALFHRLGALCRAAQMAGALEGALAMTTQYANDRVQFGRPIGKFQAIQQQLALLAEEVAAAGVAVAAAADRIAAGEAGIAAAFAKIRAGEAAGKGAEIAHQVHGAIGFTHEHPLHRLTRRLWSWRDEFGSESAWSLELGERIAAAGADAFWPLLTA